MGLASLPTIPPQLAYEKPWYTTKMDYFWVLRRFGGLFTEPVRYAIYVLPALCISFYSDYVSIKIKHKMLCVCILGMGIVVSTSGIGYLALGVFILAEMVRNLRNQKRLLMNMGIVILGICGCCVISITHPGVDIIGRLFRGGSIGVRTLRGLIIWSKSGLVHQLFGVGANNIGLFVQKYRISTVWDEADLNFVAGMTSVLVSMGVVGLTVFVYSLYKLVKQFGRITFRILGSTLIILTLFEADVYSYKFGFLLIIYIMTGNVIQMHYKRNEETNCGAYRFLQDKVFIPVER